MLEQLWCWSLAAVIAGGAGCATDNAREGHASAATPRVTEPALDLVKEATWPPDYTADPVWVRAAHGDDIDQARLARRDGAESLLAAVAQGGSLGRTALAALPHASDRRGARGALCALIARANVASRGPLLAALYEVLMDAPAAEDAIDPGADRRCAEVLKAADPDELENPGDRDRLQVVLARLQAP